MQCNDNAWCFLTEEVIYQLHQQLKHKYGISEVRGKKVNFLLVELKKNTVYEFIVNSCNITVHSFIQYILFN